MNEHLDNLRKSYELSRLQLTDAINPLEVAALFEKAQVSYVLIGGHMLSYYTGTARATVDVDFIVSAVDFSRAEQLIKRAYPHLRHHDQIYHVTFDSKQAPLNEPERIDLVMDGFVLFREVVQNYCVIVKTQSHTMKIPTVEAAIALKFAASISPNRGDENKPVDHADLLRLVRVKTPLDHHALAKLGDLIYNGGGQELMSIIADICSGKSVSL